MSERAVLDECPFHVGGGCGATGHGSDARVHPAGPRVARFWCPVERASISSLPAFLAARLPGTLDEIEAVLDVVEQAASVIEAAESARPAGDEHAVTSNSCCSRGSASG